MTHIQPRVARLVVAAAAVALGAGLAPSGIVRPVRAALVAVANPDTLGMSHDRVATVAAPGVLANDLNISLGSTTAVLVSGTGHGTVSLAADGGYTYRPSAGYVGSDQFKYRDSGLLTNTTTVTITITNATPIANDDAYSATTGVSLTVAAPGVLANDTDADGDVLRAILVDGGGSGSLSLSPDGSFTFTSGGSFVGPRTFTYQASDGLSTSGIATVTIDVRSSPATPAPTVGPTPTPTPTPPPTPVPPPTPSPTPPPTASGPPAESTPSAAPVATGPPPPTASVTPPPGTQPGTPSGAPSDGPGPTGPTPTGSAPVSGAGAPASGGGAPGGSAAADVPAAGGGSNGFAVGQADGGSIDGVAGLGIAGLGSLVDWAVPALVLTVPGLLLVLAVAAQVLGGVVWLPVARRWLGGFGVRRRRGPNRAA